jgi:hypothetical protein
MLPTPYGWLRMGDARTGDIVLDESGKPTKITGISPLWTRMFYRVTFDDGTYVDAGDTHEWNVIDLRHRPRKVADWRDHWDAAVTVETRHMAENLRENGQLRWRIPLAAPLQFPERDLLIDPYVLGVWLGDGDSDRASITIGEDKLKIVDELIAAGETPRVYPYPDTPGRYRVALPDGLLGKLRGLAVLGNKHIPMAYLRASESQRRALLAGLLDTDGFMARGPGDSRVGIDLTNKALAQGVRELLVSLGIKVGWSEGEAGYTKNGVRKTTGTRYRMNFRPLSNPFRVRGQGWADTTTQRSRVTQRTVVSVEPIGEQTSFCIEVDSPRHLYLAGEGMVPTHNSHLASRLSAWWIATTPMEEVFLVTTAPTARQVASILWRYIQRAHNLAKERGFTIPGQILSSPIPSWKINGELVGIGQKPPDKEDSAFQGFHAEKILVVIDEACGVDRSIWDAVDSLVTNESSRVLAIGNPTDPASHFRQVCSPESPLGEKWNKIRIDALRSPLMTEEACSRYPRLVEYMKEEGIPFATEEVSPTLQKTLVGPTWVYESMVGWGKDSSLFKSKVRAEFPETSSEGVIPLAWAEAAMARWEKWRDGTYIIDPDTEEPVCLIEPRAQQIGEIVIGADISDGGEDETVAAIRQGEVIRELIAFPSKDPLTTADDLQVIAAKHGAPTNAKYIVDGIGVGSGVVAKLRRDSQDTYAFIAAANSGRKDTTQKMSFINDRAAAWWNLREILNPARKGGAVAAFPRDDKLLAELTCPRFDTQPGTPKYKIEKKEDIRTRLGRSTDRADAVIQAFWLPSAVPGPEELKDNAWKASEERYIGNDDSEAVVEKWDTASDMELSGW